MRVPPFADLAHLFLKNHFELRDAAAQLLAVVPYQLGMSLGSADCSASMAVEMREDCVRHTFSDADRRYEVSVPLRAGAAQLVRVVLTEGEAQSTREIPIQGFLAASMPEAFRELHATVGQYLKALLPASFFDKHAAGAETGEPADTPAAIKAAAAESTAAQAPAGYATYVLRRTDERDLRFQGKRLAEVRSVPRNGRQHRYAVFATTAGAFVGVKVGASLWLGEQDRMQVQVASRLEELTSFFGYSALAKALYAQLGLAHEEVLD